MEEEDNRASQSNDGRVEYKAPQVAVLGKVEDLTHGSSGAVTDSVGGSLI